MEGNYVLLTEKEGMWANMLMQVLQDNRIPCVSEPVMGAGFSLKTGIQDSLRLYVPSEYRVQAEEWMTALFSQ